MSFLNLNGIILLQWNTELCNKQKIHHLVAILSLYSYIPDWHPFYKGMAQLRFQHIQLHAFPHILTSRPLEGRTVPRLTTLWRGNAQCRPDYSASGPSSSAGLSQLYHNTFISLSCSWANYCWLDQMRGILHQGSPGYSTVIHSQLISINIYRAKSLFHVLHISLLHLTFSTHCPGIPCIVFPLAKQLSHQIYLSSSPNAFLTSLHMPKHCFISKLSYNPSLLCISSFLAQSIWMTPQILLRHLISITAPLCCSCVPVSATYSTVGTTPPSYNLLLTFILSNLHLHTFTCNSQVKIMLSYS